MKMTSREDLEAIRAQWITRAHEVGTVYAKAVNLKKNLKSGYLAEYESKARALEQLETDARYHDAKDDIWQASVELPAIAAMISVLDSELRRLQK